MLELLQQNYWFLLVFLLLAAVVLFLRRRRKKKQTFRIEEDSSGFWRYHKDTQFKRKQAYGAVVAQKSKAEKKKDKKAKAIAVISFVGDMRARQHTSLAALIDEVEVNAEKITEVVAVVNSPGGTVPHYGHAFSQMERIRGLGIPLTVCIDVVGASGGYLMSLPANKIIAAPFAVVGSVGVVAFMPNIRRLLTRFDVQPRTFTAGKYKRTVTLTDDGTPEEEGHFQQQLETVHQLFSAAVAKYRTNVNLEEVTTGDHWMAAESVTKGLGLIDELGTSHEYLLKKNKEEDLVFLGVKRGLLDDGLGRFFARLADVIEERIAYSRLL